MMDGRCVALSTLFAERQGHLPKTHPSHFCPSTPFLWKGWAIQGHRQLPIRDSSHHPDWKTDGFSLSLEILENWPIIGLNLKTKNSHHRNKEQNYPHKLYSTVVLRLCPKCEVWTVVTGQQLWSHAIAPGVLLKKITPKSIKIWHARLNVLWVDFKIWMAILAPTDIWLLSHEEHSEGCSYQRWRRGSLCSSSCNWSYLL